MAGQWHWHVCWWPPHIRSRDSVSFYLVTAMPRIILQVSGVVSDMIYTTWGYPIWNTYGVVGMALRFISAWHRVTGSFLRPSLKLFSGINFQINCPQLWQNWSLIVVFQILDILILTVAIVACFLYYWHSMTCAAMKQLCVDVYCSFNRRGISKGRVWRIILEG